MSIHFHEPFNTCNRKTVEDVFKIQFACEILKLVSGSKPGYVPLNAGNQPLCHVLLHSLVSVSNIIVFFYGINLNTQDFVYLEFV